MAKAILELPEMPENCKECLLHSWESNGYTLTLICKILLVNGLPRKRRDDCPLKLVDTDMLEKQKPKKVIETPDKHKYGYCPVCGRIYWDKCHIGNYCDQCGQRLEVEP